MIAINKRNDEDDNDNNDAVQGRSEVESKEKDETEISKKYALASDILEHGGKYEEKKERLVKYIYIYLQNEMMMI